MAVVQSGAFAVHAVDCVAAAAADAHDLHPGVLGWGLFELEDHARVAPAWREGSGLVRASGPAEAAQGRRALTRDRWSPRFFRPYDGQQYTRILHKGHVDLSR